MTEIKVKLKNILDNSYSIYIGENLGQKIANFLIKNKFGQKYAIITDSKVLKLYGLSLSRFFKKNKLECEIFSFKEGEKSKNLKTLEYLTEQLLAKKFDRKDAIIALGGGVVGDIAGFLAAIYLRGIPYIQIPTTLMAMVDSSVGGKTAIDLDSGKNLLGSFHQPKAVFIDTKYLKSLPKSQISNGLAEIIKYGVIKDRALFSFIEQNLHKIFDLEQETLNTIIERSVKIKAAIVEKDEKEAGLRMILNYGHTYGHALEKLSNYQLLHGHGISIGMVLANKMAVENKFLKKSEATRIQNLLKAASLPISTMKKVKFEDLTNDKKRAGNHINFILPLKIGKVIIHKEKCL